MEFDFEQFQKKVTERRAAEIAEAQEGLSLLEATHCKLIQDRDALEEQIRAAEDEIKALKAIIPFAEGVEPKKSSVPRDSGVLYTVKQVVSPQWQGLDFSDSQPFDAIVEQVKKIKPQINLGSVRSALNKLVKDGVLEQCGRRGNPLWRYPQNSSEKIDDCENEEKEASKVQENRAEKKGNPRADIDVEFLFEQELFKAIKVNPDGVNAKVLASIFDKVSISEKVAIGLLEELEQMGEVCLERSLTGNGEVIKLPPEPGSKEELKRVRVKPKPNSLFPDMELPPHA